MILPMRLRVVGLKPPDEKWEKMRAIWKACEDAEIEIPDEVVAYFDDEEPDESGVVVELPIVEWSDDCDEDSGYELRVSDIPKDVVTIRIYNSW